MRSQYPIQLCSVLMIISLMVGCAEKIDTSAEFLAVAHRFERESKLPEAAAAYKQALALDDKNPLAWYDLGVAYAAMNLFPEAIEAYSKSIALDNGMPQAFNNRAAAYARMNQFELAIADCDRAVVLDPDDYMAWRNRALARHDHGELDSALKDYDESIRINGRNAETYHFRGNVFLDRKQWDRALEDFDQAIHIDVQMSAAWLSRAIALARLGREADADEALGKARALGSKVDDVILTDLLPAESTQMIQENLQQQAISFVRNQFADVQWSPVPTDAPWNLAGKDGEGEHKYIVRILNESGPDCGITFSANDVEQIQLEAKVATLVIVRSVPGSRSDDAESALPPTFAIVKTLENWTPDVTSMKPVVWSLPFPMESGAAHKMPVVSAAPARN